MIRADCDRKRKVKVINMKRPLYLTTTLPYVNADPHIGFALEIVQADIYARFRALRGDEVFFNTGTDEHGQKIFEAAKKAGETPQAYADHYAAKFRELRSVLGLSNDLHFIRTADAQHIVAAQEMWRRCHAAGDIYKKKYKGLYCVGDEMFLREADLVDGKCPKHPTMQPVMIEEENYFFRLSAYQERLIAYLSKNDVILPEWRRKEAIQFIERGLEDFSISRNRERLPWGIPVPDDDTQVMYVWFDALTNYISTLGWPDDAEGNFKKFWEEGETVQMAGKDQVRFQSIMWQAMLMSAGLPTTQKIVYHGHITSEGQKMSKSIGNVINPLEIVNEYGTDALRYFLARHVSPFEDSDFTMERFKEAYNADLANGLGNLAARIMKMAQDNNVSFREYFGADTALTDKYYGFPGKVVSFYDTFELNKVIDEIWNTISALDIYIQREKPFQKIKTDPEKGRKDIAYLASQLMQIASKLEPFMPSTSGAIKITVLANKKPENLFPRKE